ncbi:MAG: hypothetical protein GX321_09260 [Clostridiales bacterium]|nr:hypothetical protein [Clostridiales bacterium]
MSKKYFKNILLIVLLVSTAIFTGCSIKNDTLKDDVIPNSLDNEELQGTEKLHDIAFVQQDYFYNDTVKIEIESLRPCDIYYTLDGTDPDESKSLYKDNIKLASKSTTKVYVIKAKGYYEDGTTTDTITHTYFVGQGVENRFSTLVFSITTDPYNLYDYEYGIFIEGKLRDDYIRNNPYEKIEPPSPANFNMRGRESEREVYLEIIEPDGRMIASQKAGIRVYGGWSRANLQKSIKIFARKEYDRENNKIRYEIYPDDKYNSHDGTIIDSFKRLVLRNSGNDNGFGFIRDELFQTLAGQAGYQDFHSVRPAALFINGEYHGCYWLHEVYCDEYFEEHYGKYKGTFEVLEGGETFKNIDGDESNLYAVEDYEEAYLYTYKDLTDDAVYEKLREVIDVENYLAYYALQILIGNEDWPGNNYKVYRYYATEGEEYREAPFDGKWRYLLHDLDFSFGIYGSESWKDDLQRYVSKPGNINEDSPLFSQLLMREDCKEFFVTKTLDLINGAFSVSNLSKVVDEMNASRMKEQLHMYGKNLIADWVRPEQIPERMEQIKTYGSERITYILLKYRMYFSLDIPYTLNVQPAADGGVRINNIETDSEFTGKFFPDYDTIIRAIIPAGKELDYWLVNDEKIYDPELIINSSLVIEGNVNVTCVFKEKAEHPRIFITEVCSDGDKDYIILYNPYEEDIPMRGYSITDNENEPDKLVLPSKMLRSGKYLKILGESNEEKISNGVIRAGYNLKDGETVTLYLNGEVVDRVTIPDLEDGSKYVRDMYSLKFYEERR